MVDVAKRHNGTLINEKMKIITRNIWILSLVSLFTDVASEMLYPIMPLYLKQIGFSIALIGILEGIAEATAGLSKGYFGKMSDAKGKRLAFVQVGYFLSAISKPLLVVFVFPLWIFFARTLDRFGKGIRTGARDAMLSSETTNEFKGRVFGFHRAFDTIGATIGPAIALLFLWFYPENYKLLFLIAFIPGIFSISLTFLIKEKEFELIEKKKESNFIQFLKYWKLSTSDYRKISIGVLLFTLFNSSDVFLLLKLKDTQLGDTEVISVYIFYNLIYAVLSYPLGKMADKFGLKKTFIFGIAMFSIVYFGVAFSDNIIAFLVLFLIYGVYAASTESISKAWISNVCKKEDTATAIGTLTAFQSIATMLASFIAGLLWVNFGPIYTFISSGIIALIVILYFLFTKISER